MSDLLSAIRAHAASVPVRTITVEEWGGQELHFKPITAASRARVRKGIDPNDDGALAVAMILELALDSEGKRAFAGTAAERAALMEEVSFDLIQKILTELDGAGADPATKNG